MSVEYQGKLKTSLSWWLNKKRPFNINNHYTVELVQVGEDGKKAKIRVTRLVDGKPAEFEDREVEHDAN